MYSNKIPTSLCVQPEKKKQLEDDLEACEVKNHKRSLGNICFIGELFKLKMLSETVIHDCLARLLRSSSDEESLKCFACLITIAGKDLDKPESKVERGGVQGFVQKGGEPWDSPSLKIVQHNTFLTVAKAVRSPSSQLIT